MFHPCPEEHPWRLEDVPETVLACWIHDNAFCRKDGFRIDDGKVLRATVDRVHPRPWRSSKDLAAVRELGNDG